jgi:hypothetical protein
VNPRFGNVSVERVAPRASGLGVAAAMLVSSFEKSLAGVEPIWVRAKLLRRLLAVVVPSASTGPMRSGMASSAKPMNDRDPSTSAAHGVQRQVSTLGIPSSLMREKRTPLATS